MEKKIYLTPNVEILEVEFEAELLAGTTFDPDAPQDTPVINPQPGDVIIIPE